MANDINVNRRVTLVTRPVVMFPEWLARSSRVVLRCL